MKMSEYFEKHNAHQTADHIQGSKLKKPMLAGYQKKELIPRMVIKMVP